MRPFSSDGARLADKIGGRTFTADMSHLLEFRTCRYTLGSRAPANVYLLRNSTLDIESTDLQSCGQIDVHSVWLCGLPTHHAERFAREPSVVGNEIYRGTVLESRGGGLHIRVLACGVVQLLDDVRC